MQELTSAMVKEQAKLFGADLCGIASMDRFEGAPPQADPRFIFPRAKACIMLAFRIPRGYFRGIEEGTLFSVYPSMGYGGINMVVSPLTLRWLSCWIEDFGWEAAPVPNIFTSPSTGFGTQKYDPQHAIPVREGLPAPDILVDYRIAAFCAGLGQIGYSKVFLTPEFGPFQRFAMMLTDAPLEPDPIYEGKLCDRCMRCARACAGKAISTTETESITVAGHKIEWGKLDYLRCSTAYMGGTEEYNPFLPEGIDVEKMAESYHGKNSGKSGWNGYPAHLGHNASIEGARGCMRECYVHLEERGVLTKPFHNKFRDRKPWVITPEMRREFFARGKGEENAEE